HRTFSPGIGGITSFHAAMSESGPHQEEHLSGSLEGLARPSQRDPYDFQKKLILCTQALEQARSMHVSSMRVGSTPVRSMHVSRLILKSLRYLADGRHCPYSCLCLTCAFTHRGEEPEP